MCKITGIFRFKFGERFADALDVQFHKSLLTERMSMGGILTTAHFISQYILFFDRQSLMELLESSGGPYISHENWHTRKKGNIGTSQGFARQGKARTGSHGMGLG